MSWGRKISPLANALEERYDAARFGVKRRFGLLDPFEILPYRGHGTRRELFLRGRVLEERGITRSGQSSSLLTNLGNMARRFASDEVPSARVRASFAGIEVDTVADEEGFFDVRFELPEPLPESNAWHPVELELLSPPSPGGGVVRSTGQALVPEGARFGVISDLDDTVVRSNATNALKMAWITLLNDARTRLPFAGVSAFYQALRRGPSGRDDNPTFYVSSSPWNIYDVIEDFLNVHDVPPGPIFLKDWSLTALGKHHEHKLGLIRGLLRTYPEMPFVLVGDSGQEDPEIYVQTVREHPGRILAIYIRDVTAADRDAQVKSLMKEASDLGVEMVLTEDTAVAAEHAASAGLISPGAVSEVRSSARGAARG
ncbi:MAG TPA: phosphatase domain-containing protein [Rubrobacteraceae bacterium]|nr:phosphatase domain-containing protein [Rubrobacteraceae bacterium]